MMNEFAETYAPRDERPFEARYRAACHCEAVRYEVCADPVLLQAYPRAPTHNHHEFVTEPYRFAAIRNDGSRDRAGPSRFRSNRSNRLRGVENAS